MNLDGYFRATSYAMVATAFVAIVLTGQLDLISIFLYSAALIVSFRADAKGWTRFRLREWMWRVIALLYVPFVFLDGALTSRIIALVHLTLFLSAAKLFQDKRDRDWVFLYLIAFFQMLLAAGLTFDSTFVASLGFFIFFFISTLAAFEVRLSKREIVSIEEEIIPREKKRRPGRLRVRQSRLAEARRRDGNPLVGRLRYLVGASLFHSIMVAALTLPFFFMIPRFGGGITRGAFETEGLTTGFSDTVQLGQVAKIKESQRVVMRVRLDHKPGRYIRWRGTALDRYTGDAWQRGDQSIPEDRGGRINGREQLNGDKFEWEYVFGQWSNHPEQLEQQIVLEPSATQTIFAAPRLIRLRGALPSISRYERSGAVCARGVSGRLQYRAYSDISTPDETLLQADSSDSYPHDLAAACLQLPGDGPREIHLDPRIRQLALDKARGARTPFEKAKAIETFLKTQFTYTLDLNFTKHDPLAEFLFDAKAGHCEYFATAMAIMMRMLGVPARVVNGFQMGDYNDVNGLYTVRASDAHSWVEVYFADSRAWVEFDPTPAAGLNDYSQGGFLSRLRKYMEAAEVFWLDYIVTLDSDEQTSIMVDLQHRLLGAKDWLMVQYNSVKRWFRSTANTVLDREWDLADILKSLGLLAALTLAFSGLYIARAYLKRRGLTSTGYGPWWHRLFVLPLWRHSRLAERDPRRSAVLFYEHMLAAAARAGLVKSPDQTPIEFADCSGIPQIREITAAYNRVRFGGAKLAQHDADRISALLADLRRAVRAQLRKKRKKKGARIDQPPTG